MSDNIFSKYLTDKKDFVEIGAFVGATSIYASKLCRKVYACEPDPICFEMLQSNIEKKKSGGLCENVFIVPFAISNATRTEPLYSNNVLGNGMSSINARKENIFGIEVFCATLPDFIKNQGMKIKEIGIINIDAEGSETKIFQGAEKLITDSKPTIFASFHPAWYEDLEYDTKKLSEIVFKYPKVLYKSAQITKREFEQLNYAKKEFNLILSK